MSKKSPKKILKTFSPTLLIFCFLGLFLEFLVLGCKEAQCPDKKNFIANYQELITAVKSEKRLRSHRDWDAFDRKFRKLLHECQPNIAKELSAEEAKLLWEDALGYIYARYGLELLKKHAQTDALVVLVRDSLRGRDIYIAPTMKRLKQDWPIFYGMSNAIVSDKLEKILGEKGLELPDSLFNRRVKAE